jgi:hypothetical protein
MKPDCARGLSPLPGLEMRPSYPAMNRWAKFEKSLPGLARRRLHRGPINGVLPAFQQLALTRFIHTLLPLGLN